MEIKGWALVMMKERAKKERLRMKQKNEQIREYSSTTAKTQS